MKEFSADMLNAGGKPFGELIREYRRRRGMSQEQLGAVAHVKKNAVGAWEAGRSRPDVSCIPALCRALGMPRQALHCWRVAFRDPATGEELAAEAPPDAMVAEFLAAFG